MCGISGFCDFQNKSSHEILVNMTDSMIQRGPDSSGIRLFEGADYTVGFGHRRLSILDLSEHGHQPMSFRHLHITLNGEVYNFTEIRKELTELGYTFDSDSDTEVVLKSFHQWGTAAVEKYIGMFAFVIYDSIAGKLFLFRDRAGVKPLYYYYQNGTFLFASELRAFHKHPAFRKEINPVALNEYFAQGYISAPNSIFSDAYKLSPGHFLTLDMSTREIEMKCYWSVIDQYNQPKLKASEEEILEQLEPLLISACQYRMVADVPVGVFLSGGYDSASVTALLQAHSPSKLKTFTIGFEEQKYNEAPFAKNIAAYLGTDHHEHYCTISDARAILPLIGKMFDEPFGDSSAIPTYLVSANARKNVTVALSADGGDEIFAGYSSYETTRHYLNRAASFNPALRKLGSGMIGLASGPAGAVMSNTYNLKSRMEKVAEMMRSDGAPGHAHQILSAIHSGKEIDKLVRNRTHSIPAGFKNDLLLNEGNSVLDKLMLVDYTTYMVDDILVKVDRASMAVSLEGREPLLDHRIIEFMARVPQEFKIRNGERKYLLKKIAHKYIPKDLMDRPKSGFSIPIFEWFKGDMNDLIDQYLNKTRIEQQGLMRFKPIEDIVKRYRAGAPVNIQKIWLLLSFQMWYAEWMD